MSGFVTCSSVVKPCCSSYPQTHAPTSSRPPKSNEAGFCRVVYSSSTTIRIAVLVTVFFKVHAKKKKRRSMLNCQCVWFLIGPFKHGCSSCGRRRSHSSSVLFCREKIITWRHSWVDDADSGFFIVPIHNIPLTGQSKLQYPKFSQRGNVNPCMAATLSSGWGNVWGL